LRSQWIICSQFAFFRDRIIKGGCVSLTEETFRDKLKDRRVLVTGATSGIGKETAIGLAKLGASLTFTTRDLEMGKRVKDEIIEASANTDVEFLFCDLASFESVRKCCSEFKSKHDRLHVLVNNAGLWNRRRRISKDGIENMLAVNYLAPFLMTDLLLDTLKQSAPSRIINLSSGLHSGTINFDDIESEKKFTGFKVYRQSKLALILYTRLLAKKLGGTGVTVNCINPGMVATNLGRDGGRFSRAMFKLLGKKPEKGAETPIFLASSPEVATITGEYFSKKAVKRSSEESYDMELAERLWKVSEEYVSRK
jgi:NAD(P)-dependent dehydrogenase (short-subunit alcohol dehydrogenase family)